MDWFNWYGTVIVAFLMVPNLFFLMKQKEQSHKAYRNLKLEIPEQIGRIGCIIFMMLQTQISLRQGGVDWLSKAGYGRLYREADCYFSRKFHQACYGGADASTMLRWSATGGKKCHFIEWTGFSGGSGCHFYRWTDSFVKTLDK